MDAGNGSGVFHAVISIALGFDTTNKRMALPDMQIICSEIGETIWFDDHALPGVPMQQHPTFGRSLQLLGCKVLDCRILVDGSVAGLAQVIVRRLGGVRVGLVSRGPLWIRLLHPRTQVAALRQMARGFGALLVTPAEALSGRALLPLVTPSFIAVVDLAPTVEGHRANLLGKWRNRLVRAEAGPLKFTRATPGDRDLADLLLTESRQQSRRGYRGLPTDIVRAWRAVAPDQMLLWRAHLHGRVVAEMLVLLHGTAATYHFGWSDDCGRQQGAHQLLLWRIMLDLKQRGFRVLDLGAVDTERSPGVARFKIGTGARVSPTGATSLVIPTFTPPRF